MEHCAMPGKKLTFLILFWLLTVCCIDTAFAQHRCPTLPAIPMPVHFKAQSAEFLPIGKQAAEELLQRIRQIEPNEITLTGHADDRGSDERNMRLSDRRAKAVANFLKRSGVSANIIVIAKGKSE